MKYYYRTMILSGLLYYLIIIPVSILPFSVLHVLSRLFYVVLYYIAGYRKKVVIANIRKSFPEKTEQECAVIVKRFYNP